METIKKFTKYLFIFIALYIIFDLLVFLGTKGLQKDITKYTIKTKSPKIEIIQSIGGYSNINIEAKITNNTSKLIEKTYIKFSFYNKSNKYLLSKYEPIELLNVSETQKIKVNYNINNVDYFNVIVTQEFIEEPKREETEFEKTIYKWWPVIGILTFVYFLP